MSKHTPGPWSVGNGSSAIGFTVKIASDELLVGGRGLKSEANARLIAAAPELLSFAIDYISAYETGFDGDEHLMILAKALVIKAGGEP